MYRMSVIARFFRYVVPNIVNSFCYIMTGCVHCAQYIISDTGHCLCCSKSTTRLRTKATDMGICMEIPRKVAAVRDHAPSCSTFALEPAECPSRLTAWRQTCCGLQVKPLIRGRTRRSDTIYGPFVGANKRKTASLTCLHQVPQNRFHMPVSGTMVLNFLYVGFFEILKQPYWPVRSVLSVSLLRTRYIPLKLASPALARVKLPLSLIRHDVMVTMENWRCSLRENVLYFGLNFLYIYTRLVCHLPWKCTEVRGCHIVCVTIGVVWIGE
jgi:hypothetical protein